MFTYDHIGPLPVSDRFLYHSNPFGALGADVRSFAGALDAFSRRDYSAGVLRILSIKAIQDRLAANELSSETKKLLARFQQHAALVASIAQAKQPEDVERALQAAAAPIGSWREFRRRPHAGFLGAMLGFGGGAELAFSSNGTSGAFFMPVLPIGFEIGLGRAGSSSFNLLLSVVDLGALAAVRVQNQSSGTTGADKAAKLAPDSTFLAVLAPGATIAWGIADSPFVLALGAEFAPANRQFFECSGECSTTKTLATLRLHTFVGIDLPVLPLF